MEAHNYNYENTIVALVSEYEAMSQKGTVGFLEEKVFLKLIDYYQETEELDRAIEVADHAVRQYSYTAQFYTIKAAILLEQDRNEAALDCLEKAEIYAPGEPEVLLLRAKVFSALGYTEDAFAILERIKSHVDKDVKSEIFYCEACLYEKHKQFDQMFYALKDCLLLNPEHTLAMRRIWLSVELSELFEESITLYEQLIDIDAYNCIAWYNMGYAWYCLGDYKKAIESFEYAYVIDPHFEYAYRDCAECWIQLENFEKALSCYEEAVEHIKPDAALLLRIGYCYECQSQFNTASSFYAKSIELDPNNDTAYFRLGECYGQEKRWPMAIQAYNIAIELDSKKEEYLAAIAEVYYQIDELKKAAYFFQKAIDTAPDFLRYWIQYATFLMETGRAGSALELLEEAHEHVAGGELAYCKIACYFHQGKRSRAMYELREVLEEHNELWDALFDLLPELEYDTDVQNLIAAYTAH